MAEARPRRPLRLLAAPFAVLLILPLAVALAMPLLLIVLLVDLLWTPVVLLRRRPTEPRPRDTSAASIVVVSWNGLHFLKRLMPTLAAAVREHGGDHEVIVVDNGSNDGTAAWLAQEHPSVKVVALPENRFFTGGTMAGAAAATRDVLLFLNNDMELRPGFLAPLLDGLRDPRVFAVTAEVFFLDPQKRREETGRTRGRILAGGLKLAHTLPSRDERAGLAPVFWAGGGSTAFDRRLFHELGGFDHLYEPFYLEDTGLSWQAWKRGYFVLFTSRSQVLHAHRGTSRKAFGDAYVDAMIRRNQHLFLWRSITDAGLTAQIWGLLPLQFLLRAGRSERGLAAGLWAELRAFLRALPRLPLALAGRCRSRLHTVRSDRQAMALANGVTAARLAGAPSVGRAPDRGLRVLMLSARLPRLHLDGSWTLFERLRCLAANHRVTLFAFVDEPAEAALCEPLQALGIEVVTAVRERNPLPGNWHGFLPRRLHRDYSAPAMAEALQRAIEGTDFDLVQVEYVEMAHLLRKVRTAIPHGVPVIYTCHESLALAAARQLENARGFAERLRLSRAYAAGLWHERRLFRMFDRVVTLSDAEAGWLRARVPGLSVSTVPSGIAVAKGEGASVAEEPATIVFVGYYKHEPNVDAAVWLCRDVLPHVRAAVPHARVELVGREPPPSLEHFAATAGSAVTLRGYVPDLEPVLARATVVAMPIRQGGGLRGKVLEAWAAGRPVVATSVALEGFAAEPEVHCLRADDAAAFAAAIVRVMQDKALRDKLGRAGRELVRARYSCEATGAGHEAVIREVMARRNGR